MSGARPVDDCSFLQTRLNLVVRFPTFCQVPVKSPFHVPFAIPYGDCGNRNDMPPLRFLDNYYCKINMPAVK